MSEDDTGTVVKNTGYLVTLLLLYERQRCLGIVVVLIRNDTGYLRMEFSLIREVRVAFRVEITNTRDGECLVTVLAPI